MKSVYVILLLSLFTGNTDVYVRGNDGHTEAIITGRSTNMVAANENRPQPRNLQTMNYRANYTADFQHLVAPSCTADAPFLAIICYGQKIEITNVSHPSINCRQQNVANYTASYICNNTCIDDNTCDEVYRTNDSSANSFETGVHGSILFMCEGDTVQDVKAEYILSGINNTGSCTADSTNAMRNNLRVARLGVLCPNINGDGSDSDEQLYVFDDTYFECRSDGTITGDTASHPNDSYACFNGKQCGGEDCSIDFLPIEVQTHLPSFADECVQASVPIDGFPTPVPQSEALLYKVHFEASWSTFNNDTRSCSSNDDVNPGIQIKCGSNGGTTIEYVNATDTAMRCINIQENVLQCVGNPSQSLNNFTTVAYDCTSSTIPSSSITYPDSSAYCENNVNVEYISNWVSLRAICNNGATDLYLECAETRHNFVHLLDPNNLDGLRYMCIEGAIFDSNSAASSVQIIPNVTITTDEFWQRKAGAKCYEQLDSGSTRSPVTIATPAPTFAPNQPAMQPEPGTTVAPVINPPTSAPSPMPNNVIPITAPTAIVAPVLTSRSPANLFPTTPSIPPGSTLPASSGGKDNNKVLIFAAVGGIIGGIIVSILLFMVYNKGRHDAVFEEKDEAFPPAKDHNDTENNTESHSQSMQQSSNQTESGSPTILSIAALASPVETTPSDFYEVHYKDQSRSVIGTANVNNRPGGMGNKDKAPITPVLARYYKADNVKNPKPTSGIEIPTVTAVMCTDISMLGESDSSIRRFADSNSSLRMLHESNRSAGLTSTSNSSIPTESDTDKIIPYARKKPPTSSLLADSDSVLEMVGDFNRSFHILDNSSSTIPTESNANSDYHTKKKPAIVDPDGSFRIGDDSISSFHALEDSNSTLPTQSNVFTSSNSYNRYNTVNNSNSSLRMVRESNDHMLEDSNSTIRTESNTESNNYIGKKAAIVDPDGSFHISYESDSNSTIPAQSTAFSNNDNRYSTMKSPNSSLRMVRESNDHTFEDSNSTIRTESNTENNTGNSMKKKPACPSTALEL